MTGPTTVTSLQEAASDWLRTTFNERVLLDPKERALRVLEEALELAQASGVSTDLCLALTDQVYAKPLGKPEDEVVDVAICALVAATAHNLNLGRAIVRRLAWAQQNVERIRAKNLMKVRNHDAYRERGTQEPVAGRRAEHDAGPGSLPE